MATVEVDYPLVSKNLNKIPYDRILRFRVGGGYALYYVDDIEKAILQRIPYGDLSAPPDVLEKLTSKDIKAMLFREGRFHILLSNLVIGQPEEKKKDKSKDKKEKKVF